MKTKKTISKKTISVMLTLVLVFSCAFSIVGLDLSKKVFANNALPAQYAKEEFPALNKFYYSIDDSKITKPVIGEDIYDENFNPKIKWSCFDATSPFKFHTDPAVPQSGFKAEGTDCSLLMLNKTGDGFETELTKWTEGRKYALCFEVKIIKAVAGYCLKNTPNVEEPTGTPHNVIWVVPTDQEVRMGWTAVGTLGPTPEPTPTPEPETPKTFNYDSTYEANNFLTAGLIDSKENLFAKAFNEADKAKAKAETTTKSSVFLKAEDITSSIGSTDKEAIENELPEGYQVNSYADINLYKQFNDEEPEKITECSGDIHIRLDIPNDIQDKNYKIIGLHDGKSYVLDPAVDGSKLSFATSKFSTYAIAFADKASDVSDTTPSTEDSLLIPIALLILTAACFGTVIYLKRRNN